MAFETGPGSRRSWGVPSAPMAPFREKTAPASVTV